MAASMGAICFQPGEFYGCEEARRSHGAFSIASLTAAGREQDIEVHTHDHAHFVLVLGGGYLSSARGGRDVTVSPAVVFNPPGTTHRDRFLGGKGRFLALSLSETVAEAEDEAELGGPARWLHDLGALRAAVHLERTLRSPQDHAIALEGAALQLVASTRPAGTGERAPPAWLRRAVEMILETTDPEIGVCDVAADAGVHPVHLARVFGDWLGCAPGEYLRGRRLERAVALLGRTATALAEVAAETGFTDQAHMTRRFKSRFGVTPAQVRRDVAPVQDGLGARA